MNEERLKSVIRQLVSELSEGADDEYFVEVIRDMCGLTYEELMELDLEWVLDIISETEPEEDDEE